MAPTVVGIAGSIRNRAGLDAVDGVDVNVDRTALVDGIRALEHRDIYHDQFLGEIKDHLEALAASDERVITNSDALVLASLYGANGSSEVEFHKLTDYVGLDESYARTHVDSQEFERLEDTVREASGVILGTPVYFGDRSSLLHSFIEFAAERDLFADTVVGAVSCGSKRNGGQETTNVYALFETLDHGAVIVGNGPKTCQYGGTGWGGDIGDVVEDDFGLETSMGTGLRVSAVANTLERVAETPGHVLRESAGDPFTVGIVIARDQDDRLRTVVEQTIESTAVNGVEYTVINVADAFIQACIGCDVCPTPGKVDDISGSERDYKCIIDEELDADRWADDQLQDIHADLMANDALVIGVMDTTDDEAEVDDVYQTFLERTRYIRRDDWRLHNTPLMAYVLTDPETQTTFPMKIMTSWMRHNTIVYPPVVQHRFVPDRHEGVPEGALAELSGHYAEQARAQFADFVRRARKIRGGANLEGSDTLSYKATGYRNKILDGTTAERS